MNRLKGVCLLLIILVVNFIGIALLSYPFEGSEPYCTVYISDTEVPVQDMAGLERMLSSNLPKEIKLTLKSADGIHTTYKTLPITEIDGKYLTAGTASEMQKYITPSMMDSMLFKLKTDQAQLLSMVGLTPTGAKPEFRFGAKDLRYNTEKLTQYMASALRTDFNITSQPTVDDAVAQIVQSITEGNIKEITVTCAS